MPQVPGPVGDQRLGFRRLEICAMPALLSPGAHHLERTVLSPATLDRLSAQVRRHSVPLRGLPVQFRELQALQGTLFLAEEQSGAAGSGRASHGGGAVIRRRE
jgi:hypothetical protein